MCTFLLLVLCPKDSWEKAFAESPMGSRVERRGAPEKVCVSGGPAPPSRGHCKESRYLDNRIKR